MQQLLFNRMLAKLFKNFWASRVSIRADACTISKYSIMWGSANWPSGYTLLAQISMSFGIIVACIWTICHSVVRNKNQNVATSLIDGKMTHTLASLWMGKDEKLGNESMQKLQRMWESKEYLIIDEYSIISKSFLALLSKNIGIGKQGSATEHSGYSLGGVNVILCGDSTSSHL